MSIPYDQGPDADLHKPPKVEVALPDIQGGEANLLPVSATQADLKVAFEPWPIQAPAPFSDKVQLFWNDAYLTEGEWYSPINPDDLFLMVPQNRLGEGVHVIYYRVTAYNGAVLASEPLTITIDKTAPILNQTDERLVFPRSVVDDGVTAWYLENNDDKVLAEIPGYDVIKPGDVLTWFWDRAPFSPEEVDSTELSLADVSKPLIITFEGDMIRARDDGERYAYYRVQDRAGNTSVDARPVILTAAAKPVPRDLPWPDVDKAAGSGEVISLVPENVALGATVIVPDTFVLNPDEVIWVQWAEPGALGAFRTSTPAPANSRRYAVPKEHVAPHVGKRLPVKYEVVGPKGTEPSAVRQLELQKLNIDNLPIIQCEDRTGGTLSLALIPASGARFKLGTWTLMATTQRITIELTGTSVTGQPIKHTVLNSHAVTSAELISGIGAAGNVTAPKTFMSQLKRNARFSIQVYVSFDEGLTWPLPGVPNFPTSDDITLVD